MDVYVIPQLSSLIGGHDILIGYKGNTEFEAGAFFLPYKPLKIMEKFLDVESWVWLRSLGSMYAKAMDIMPQLYGRIQVSGL